MKKLLRKISPKSVCEEKLKRLDVAGAPKEVVLYDVYGVTNNFSIKTNDFGQSIQFKGQFEAETPDGEVFASGSVYLQAPFEDMLFSQLETVKSNDANGTVQFACRISIVPPPKDKKSSTGYEYQCTPLLQSNDSPLDSVRALVAEAKKSLALPANASSKDKSAKATA